MKFDYVIGNPPYNNAKEALDKDKHDAKKQGTATYYKHFIKKANNWIKDNGKIIYVLPPGAHKFFYNNNLNIYKIIFVDGKIWNKTLVTRAWFCDKQSTAMPIIYPKIIDKLVDFKQMLVRGGIGGISVYNFTMGTFTKAENKVYRTSWMMKQNKSFQSKNNIRFHVNDTEQNKNNLIILLDYLDQYLHYYGYQWHSWNKLLDYKWIEQFNRNITEQDIIKHYGLTDDEVKEIKNK